MNPTVITDIPFSILPHRLSNYKEEEISFAALFRHCLLKLRSMSNAFQIKCIDSRGVHSVGQTIKLKQTDMETHDALLTLQC